MIDPIRTGPFPHQLAAALHIAPRKPARYPAGSRGISLPPGPRMLSKVTERLASTGRGGTGLPVIYGTTRSGIAVQDTKR